MKRVVAMVFAVSVILFSDCSESKENTGLTVETLKADNALIYGTGGEVELRVDSYLEWTAELVEADADLWVALEKRTVAGGSDKVVIRTERNDTENDRTATVRIGNGVNEHRVSFTQKRNIFDRKPLKIRRVSNSVGIRYDRRSLNRVVVILPVPRSNLYQDIVAWNSPNGELKTASDGHTRYIRRELIDSSIPPSGDIFLEERFTVRNYSVEVDFDAVTPQADIDRSSDVYRQYTRRNGDIIYPDLPVLLPIADRLWKEAGEDKLRYARLCYEYVAENMRYLNPDTGLHPLRKILAEGGGDCGNQATVFISLLRNKKIPARHVVMIRTDQTFHVRSEFFLVGYGWIPVDVNAKNMNPSGDYFGKIFSDEIVLNNNIDFDVALAYNQEYRVDILQNYAYWYWWNGEPEPKVEAFHSIGEVFD